MLFTGDTRGMFYVINKCSEGDFEGKMRTKRRRVGYDGSSWTKKSTSPPFRLKIQPSEQRVGRERTMKG